MTNDWARTEPAGRKQTVRRSLVIGAGVSGCACAAVLAEAGATVILVNPALDHVGEPAFGPGLPPVGSGGERVGEVLGRLPAGLRQAWERAVLGTGREGMAAIDRRMLSVETKRALETTVGVELRQGLVTCLSPGTGEVDVGGVSGPVLRAETVFGESLVGETAIVAVGLSLGGVAKVGETVVGGGRYGQPNDPHLEEALGGLGAEFLTGRAETMMSLSGAAGGPACGCTGGEGEECGRSAGGRAAGHLKMARFERARHDWGAQRMGEPPSPYEEDGASVAFGLVRESEGRVALPVLIPDGLATAEMTVCLGSRSRDVKAAARQWYGAEELVVSRPSCRVTGLIVKNVGPGGRLEPAGEACPAVWVTGRAGGAADYVDSLAAGIRTGLEVARFLGYADA